MFILNLKYDPKSYHFSLETKEGQTYGESDYASMLQILRKIFARSVENDLKNISDADTLLLFVKNHPAYKRNIRVQVDPNSFKRMFSESVCTVPYKRFFEEDSSSSIEEILSKNFGKDFAKAIEKGYEGILWDSPVEEFLPEVHGLDILYKTMMVLDGTYRAWDNDFFRYKGDENFFKKYISFLVEIYNKYNLPKLGKNIKKYYKKHKERFRESDSLNTNFNKIQKITGKKKD